MIDAIIACKPKSIFDIIPESFYTEVEAYPYLYTGNYYEWMYAVAKVIQPRSFLEIGVRAGFSFLPVLKGSEALETALGWDLETYGNNALARIQLNHYYTGTCCWTIEKVNSQTINTLPQKFDLINIDGDHSYDGKMHDLRLTIGHCKYVIVVDFDYLIEVRKAVTTFLDVVGSSSWGQIPKVEYAIYIPPFRGSMLIKYK